MMKRNRDGGEVEAQAMANCLMLLSSIDRDRRINSFECKTCKKTFSSFQALGGHRTSHKSLKSLSIDAGKFPKKQKVVHECSICGMEFSTGQALGGHMRRHRAGPVNETEGSKERRIPVLKKSNSSKRILCLDLNLTPDENDDDFQLWHKPMAPAPVLRCFF